ncbi:MAG: hypothetical protein ABFC77_04235 [Thermoguttaceae bacterium]
MTKDGILRWRPVRDTTQMSIRRLSEHEHNKLEIQARRVLACLENQAIRQGPIIDFDRICLKISDGEKKADVSFNMNIGDFLSSQPLRCPDDSAVELNDACRELRMALVEDIAKDAVGESKKRGK